MHTDKQRCPREDTRRTRHLPAQERSSGGTHPDDTPTSALSSPEWSGNTRLLFEPPRPACPSLGNLLGQLTHTSAVNTVAQEPSLIPESALRKDLGCAGEPNTF